MEKRLAVPTLVAVGMLVLGVGGAAGQSVDAQVATAVVDRMPEGGGTSFPADVGELFVWTRITDAGGTSIQHVWIHDGNEWPVTLAVGGSPWRTWSSKVIPPEWMGEWTVEVRSSDGTVLESVSFTVG
jgi:hypothetical protein